MAQGGSAGVAEEYEVVDVDGLFNFATARRGQSNQTNLNPPRARSTGAVASPSSPRDRSITGHLLKQI